MKHRILASTLLCLAGLPLACMMLLAQDANNLRGIVGVSGGPGLAKMRSTGEVTPSTMITPSVTPDTSKLYAIFDTLGSATDRYDDQNGTYVSGPVSAYGAQQWLAYPFWPQQNAVITVIELGAQWISGPNAITVTLNEDNNYLPGKVLRTWNLTNLPTSPSCCQLASAKDAKGIPVTQYKGYWVVLKTNANTTETLDVWDSNFEDYNYPAASIIGVNFGNGDGWLLGLREVPAIGIFGEKAN